MNCIHLKQKMNKTIYCKIKNAEIHFKDCNNCSFKEYRAYKQLQTKSKYKYKPKRGKCGRYYNDISIMPPSTLYFIKKTKGCEKHHIFGGVANRPKSEQYGLFIWLTPEQHKYLHDHPLEMIKLKKIAQATFMNHCNKNVDEFRELFGKSLL
jgi:hypothetical protein